jgi:hypothetical protein
VSDWDHFEDQDEASPWFFSCCKRKAVFKEKRIARIV